MEHRILVTGASGFIGTNLIDALVGRKTAAIVNLDPKPTFNPTHEPYRKPVDIMDKAALLAAFAEFKPTDVIHLAARAECDENTTVEAGYKVNTEGTANVLAAIKATPGIRRAIITSTQFVFNKGAILPQGDLDYHPITVYGQSKIITEQLTRDAGLTCCWTLVRPTNVWGPWHIRHTQQFFKVLGWGLYAHPGREPVMRSYAFIGNVIEQYLRILEVDEARVNGKTLYLGDAPLDILDWVNGFSLALRGRKVAVIPRPVIRTVARAGDFVSKLSGRQFFITSSRFQSMTDPYLTPMEPTFQALGPNKYDLGQGIDLTVKWLKSRKGG